MAENLYVEFGGEQVNSENVVATVKQFWKDSGNMVRDIQNLDVYYKPEERMFYYVINQDFSGSFSIEQIKEKKVRKSNK